jgi:hypothetical protein
MMILRTPLEVCGKSLHLPELPKKEFRLGLGIIMLQIVLEIKLQQMKQ